MNGLRKWISSNCRFAAADPTQYGEQQWVELNTPNMTWEQRYSDENIKNTIELRRQWKAAISYKVATGQMSIEEATAKKFHFNAPERDVGKLPEILFHVTTNKAAVGQMGIKTRDELGQGSGKGLGGGTSDTVSFTADIETARAIKTSLLEARKIARGELTIPEMIEMARQGGFLNQWFDYYYNTENQNDPRGPIPKDIQDIMNGTEEASTGLPYSLDQYNQRYPNQNWEGGKVWPYGEQNFTTFRRKLNPQELRDKWFTLYKSFSHFRESAGGAMNPLFFGSDVEGLANTPEDQIAILEFRSKPGAQGYQVSALGEWRTWTGDAVELVGEVE